MTAGNQAAESLIAEKQTGGRIADCRKQTGSRIADCRKTADNTVLFCRKTLMQEKP